MFLLSSTIDFKLFADVASGAGLTSDGTGLTDGGTLLTSSFGSGLAAGAGAGALGGGGAAGAGALGGGGAAGAGAGVTGAATAGFPRSSIGGGVGFTSSFFASLGTRLNTLSKTERFLSDSSAFCYSSVLRFSSCSFSLFSFSCFNLSLFVTSSLVILSRLTDSSSSFLDSSTRRFLSFRFSITLSTSTPSIFFPIKRPTIDSLGLIQFITC